MSLTDQCSVPFVDLKACHEALREELTQAWLQVLDAGDFILGRAVEQFEQEFAAFCGVREAIGVGNGLDALRLTLLALGIGPGDEVIVPANTFIATALAVTGCGARPVLVDCDPETYNLDVDQVTAAITPQTRAILPVHLAGLPAAMDPLSAVAGPRGIAVVEDACQAHGAAYQGRVCGGLGIAGCFSFYPAKNLGALGDGGMVVTNDRELAEQLRRLRNYGQQAKYHHVVAGVNSRLDAVQAAILRVKLQSLPAGNDARRQHAARYRELLDGVGDLRFQHSPDGSRSVYHLFIMQTASRDRLRDALATRGVQTGIHYPIPVHLQPAYAQLGHQRGDFPVAERLAETMLSLPMYPELTTEQIDYVAGCIREFFTG